VDAKVGSNERLDDDVVALRLLGSPEVTARDGTRVA